MREQDRTTRIIRSLRSGQITIPVDFRRVLGIEQDTVLQMTLEGGELRIRPVRVAGSANGSEWFQRLYQAFAPVREGAMQEGSSEEEINTAIDRAVAAVRRKHDA